MPSSWQTGSPALPADVESRLQDHELADVVQEAVHERFFPCSSILKGQSTRRLPAIIANQSSVYPSDRAVRPTGQTRGAV